MTQNQKFVLLHALKEDGPFRYRAIYYALGERAWPVLNSLKVGGLLSHPGYDRWEITERGRIAAAFLMANMRVFLPSKSRAA